MTYEQEDTSMTHEQEDTSMTYEQEEQASWEALLEWYKEEKRSLQAAEKRYKEVMAEVQPKIDQAEAPLASARAKLQRVEAIMRRKAVSDFEKTGAKKMPFGIRVAIRRQPCYSDADAFEWAKAHGLCLQLDRKGFERLVLSEAVYPDFVEIREVPIALIPRNLGEESGEPVAESLDPFAEV